MKRVVFLISLFISLVSEAQIPGFVPYNSKVKHLGIAVDSTILIPYRDTTYTPLRIGALNMRPADSSLYVGVSTTAGTKRWQKVKLGNNAVDTTRWSIFGNGGTTPGTHFMGTTDNQDVVFKRNGILVGRWNKSADGLNQFYIEDSTNYATRGMYTTAIQGGKFIFRHSGPYTSGCTTCGLNSYVMQFLQNASYPGGVDTAVGGFGAHIGPNDKHFFLADLTDTYSGPGIPAGRLVTVEKYGTPFVSFYNNPANNNAQFLVGFYPGWFFTNYEKYRMVVGGKSAFNDTIYVRGKMGFNTETPDASSVLDIVSTTNGVLLPRMNTTQQNAIGSPANGLLLYNTDSSAFNYYNGSAWAKIGSGGSGGGSGTVNSGSANRLAYYASTGTAVSNLAGITANRLLISDASGLPTHSAVTNTEAGYLTGVTSAIQTQLDGKASLSANNTWTGTNQFNKNVTIGQSSYTAGMPTMVVINYDGSPAYGSKGLQLNDKYNGGSINLQNISNKAYFTTGTTPAIVSAGGFSNPNSGSDLVFGGSSIYTTTDAMGIGTNAAPAASAMFEIKSTTKGLLLPRMTGSQAEAISSPADGLLVYINNGNGSTITSVGFWGVSAGSWVKLN